MIKPLDAARQLASWGFVVLPAKYQGKAPTVKWEDYQTTPPDAASLERWFGGVALSNYWILCGRPSRIVVLDCDNKEAIAWAHLEIGTDVLESTPSVKTGKGMHFYFRLPDGVSCQQWSAHGDGPAIDVRSDGGGVIAPPSMHRQGIVYRWQRSPDEGWQDVPEVLLRSPKAEEPAKEPTSGLAALLSAPPAEGNRNEWLTRVAGHYAKQMPFEDGYRQSVALAAAACKPPLGSAEVKKVADSVWKAERRHVRPAADRYTDMGNARRFCDRHANVVRYLEGRGFMAYEASGGTYTASEPPVMSMAAETVAEIYEEATGIGDSKERSKVRKWAERSSSARGIESMLRLARADGRIQAGIADFDADPMLLNVRNGVLDLRTAKLHVHDSAYMMTKSADVAYDAQAACPLWDAHLDRIFDHDPAVIQFFQRLCGYAVTGDPCEQKLAILHGYGANGKSVTVETLRAVLGSYAETTDFKTFSITRSDGPRNDLARLAGSRFVTASETGSRQWLDEAVVKQVTGGEPITARFLHREFFSYTPAFTVFLSTNHRPNIEGIDRGLWRRILLVPFEVTIEEPDQDPHLTQKLRGELPGILNWLIAGCIAWQSIGLDPPLCVQTATADYRDDADVVGQFMDEHMEATDDTDWILLADVHTRFQGWAVENGYRRMSSQQLGGKLREKGVTLTKDAPGSHRTRVRGHRLTQTYVLPERADLQ